MKKVSSDDLRLPLSIAEPLSFSRTAAKPGLSPSALSHALHGLMSLALACHVETQRQQVRPLTQAGDNIGRLRAAAMTV